MRVSRCVQAFQLGALLALGTVTGGCAPESPSEIGETGKLQLPLVGQSASGDVYRVTGIVAVRGTTWAEFEVEGDVFEMELPVGEYIIGFFSWEIFRVLPGGGTQQVVATLTSTNPYPFVVKSQEVTTVPLQFSLGKVEGERATGLSASTEVDLTLGGGEVTFSVEVEDGVIDDFADGNADVLVRGGRDGSWFTSNDATGSQTPAPGTPALPQNGGDEQGLAMHTVGTGFDDWGASLAAHMRTDGGVYDASGYVGVRFKYKAAAPARFEIETTGVLPPPVGTCASNCNRGHGIRLPASSAWRQVTLRWDQLTRQASGTPVAFEPDEVHTLEWSFAAPGFDVWVDDVEFLSRLPADPAVVGEWSEVIPFPAIPIHGSLLPNQKILFWGTGLQSPSLFDPSSGAFETSALEGVEVFCSGHSFLADGRLLVTGGQAYGINGYGLASAYAYDASDDSWTRLPDMNGGRWYPTNVSLADGRVLVAAGSTTPGVTNYVPQIYDPASNSWQDLPGAARNYSFYPMMHLTPDGRVFHTGPERTTFFIDLAGDGSFIDGPSRNGATNGFSEYGTSIPFVPGKIAVIGGGDPPESVVDVIDLNEDEPVWRTATPMSQPRRQHNSIILADGTILVTGGTSGPTFNNLAGAVLTAELWDPETDTWQELAPAFVPRVYHSVSILLPDGRVFYGGGGSPAPENGGSDNYDAEIFSPPYLFKGPRPVVQSVPARASYGEPLVVRTRDADEIVEVQLIRHTSVTHSTNMDQRAFQPRFKAAATGRSLRVTIPADANVLPPGPYLLFLLNAEGVPSEGRVVLVGN